MDKSREQFEAWYKSKYLFQGYEFDKLENGSYQWVEPMWQSWQASRAVVEIELPEVTEKRWWSSWHGEFRYEAFWLEVRRVLISHGLKVVNK